MGKAMQWVKNRAKEVGSKVRLSALSGMAVKEVLRTRKVRACVLVIGGSLLLSLGCAWKIYRLQDKNKKLTNEVCVLQEKMKRVFKELGIPQEADHHQED